MRCCIILFICIKRNHIYITSKFTIIYLQLFGILLYLIQSNTIFFSISKNFFSINTINYHPKKKRKDEKERKREIRKTDEKKFFLFSSVISQASSHPPHNRSLGSLFPLFIVLLMNHVCNSKTCSRFEWPGLLLARNTSKPCGRVRIKKLRLFVSVHCISMHRCLFKCSCIGFVRLTFNSLETRFE